MAPPAYARVRVEDEDGHGCVQQLTDCVQFPMFVKISRPSIRAAQPLRDFFAASWGEAPLYLTVPLCGARCPWAAVQAYGQPIAGSLLLE